MTGRPSADGYSRGVLAALLLAFTLAWFSTLDHRRLIKPDEGRYADAVAALRRALGKDSSLAKAHYNLAQALEAIGSPGEARRVVRRWAHALRLRDARPQGLAARAARLRDAATAVPR